MPVSFLRVIVTPPFLNLSSARNASFAVHLDIGTSDLELGHPLRTRHSCLSASWWGRDARSVRPASVLKSRWVPVPPTRPLGLLRSGPRRGLSDVPARIDCRLECKSRAGPPGKRYGTGNAPSCAVNHRGRVRTSRAKVPRRWGIPGISGSGTAHRKKTEVEASLLSGASGAERSASARRIFGANTPTGARRGAVARSLTGRSSSSNVRRVGATIRLRRRAATASRRWSADACGTITDMTSFEMRVVAKISHAAAPIQPRPAHGPVRAHHAPGLLRGAHA